MKNREIKFRCWNVEHKFWMNQEETYMQVENQARWNPELSGHYHLMQYTGLKDKAGQEIFEGDILEYSTSRNGSVSGTVIWEQQACAFWFKWKDGLVGRYKELKATFSDGEIYRYDSVEIIGNIYELINPAQTATTSRQAPPP